MIIDPSNIIPTECEQREFPVEKLGLAQRPPGFQVVVPRSVLNEIKKFGRASMRSEVGGMLVGVICWDKEPYVEIEAAIEGKYTDNLSSSVTFTSQTWDYVHAQKDLRYPNSKIVGWYHTHPSFGVFLSKYDLFICRETFNAPFHVAYVFDPHIEDLPESEGFFVWKDSRMTAQMPHVIEDIPSMINKYPSHVWRIGWTSAVQKTEAEISGMQQQKTGDKIRIVIPPEPESTSQPLPLITPQALAALKRLLSAAPEQTLAALKRVLATREQTAEPIPPKEEPTPKVTPREGIDVIA